MENVTATIDSDGNLTIEFPEDMNFNYSKPFLNESYLNVSIEHHEEDQSDTRNTKLSWELVSFNKTKLFVKVTFKKPTDISIYRDDDKVLISERNLTHSIFMKANGNLTKLPPLETECPV